MHTCLPGVERAGERGRERQGEGESGSTKQDEMVDKDAVVPQARKFL